MEADISVDILSDKIYVPKHITLFSEALVAHGCMVSSLRVGNYTLAAALGKEPYGSTAKTSYHYRASVAHITGGCLTAGDNRVLAVDENTAFSVLAASESYYCTALS